VKLYRNLAHLFIWQGSTFLVPLIVTPYLTRTLGIHAFGIYGLALAVTAYGVLLTNWGFSLSATQKIAHATDDPELLRRLFWGTLLAKQMLLIAAIVLLVVATVAVPQFRAIWPAITGAALIVIATSLTANWFLQGLQMMGFFAGASLAGRLLSIPLTFIFVHRPADAVIAAAIYGGTQLISAVASLVVSARIMPLGRPIVDPKFALEQIRDGWYQFASTLSVSLYVQANPIFIGVYSGTVQAGLLTGSQRLQAAFSAMLVPVTMATYPQINRLTHQAPARAVRMMFKLLGAQFAYGCCLGLAMYLIAPYVVPAFLGPEFTSAVEIVQILAFIPALSSITNVLGTNMLLPLGLKRHYTVALVCAGFANIGLLFLFAAPYGALGAAICSTLTESFLAVMFGGALYAHRKIFGRMKGGESPVPNAAQ